MKSEVYLIPTRSERHSIPYPLLGMQTLFDEAAIDRMVSEIADLQY